MKNACKIRYGPLIEEIDNNFVRAKNEYPDSVTSAYNLLINYRIYKPKVKKERQKNNNNNNKEQTTLSFAQDSKRKCFKCGAEDHIAPNCPKNNKNNKQGNTQRGTTNTNIGNNNNNNGSSNEASNSTTSENASSNNSNQSGNQFVTIGETNNGYDGFCLFQTTKNTITYICGKEDRETVCFLNMKENNRQKMYEHMAREENTSLRDCLLPDNESTCNIFCNKKYVKNIRKAEGTMTITTNGGELCVNKIADFLGFPKPVWFDERAISNILCYADLADNFHIIYDNAQEDAFLLFKKNGDILKFTRSKCGIYFHNLINRQIVLLNTVKENELGYTKQQIEQARRARKLYGMIGYPSVVDFKNAIKNNLINNCPITIQDIEAAEKIYGPDIAALKGKTTRKQPMRVNTEIIAVPESIKRMHHNVILGGDIFFANGHPFLVTFSNNIKLTTSEPMANRSVSTIMAGLKKVINLYNSRGFNVQMMLMDNDFAPLESELNKEGVILNTTGANDHVPAVERNNRVIRERVHAGWSRLPYKACIPKIIVRALVENTIMWLNNFPRKGGVSQTIEPCALMGARKLDFNIDCRCEFGQYVQTHEYEEPRNSLEDRTLGAICLGPSGNRQGTYKFMSLKTGKLIKRGEWTEIPITDEVIRHVIEIGAAENDFCGLKFNNHCGIIQEEYAPDYVDIAGVCDLTEEDEEKTTTEEENYDDEDDEEAQKFLEEEDEYENNPDKIVVVEERRPTVVKDLEGEEEFLKEEPPVTTEMAEENANVNTEDNTNNYTTRSERRVQPTNNYIPSTRGKKYDQTTLVQTCFMQTVKHILKTTCNTQHTLNAGIKKLG